jgi:hypothetical protein
MYKTTKFAKRINNTNIIGQLVSLQFTFNGCTAVHPLSPETKFMNQGVVESKIR